MMGTDEVIIGAALDCVFSNQKKHNKQTDGWTKKDGKTERNALEAANVV